MIGKGTNLWQLCHMCLIMTDSKEVYYHRFINVFTGMTLCKNSKIITNYQYAIRKLLTNWVGSVRKKRFDFFVPKINWKHSSTLSFFAKKVTQSVLFMISVWTLCFIGKSETIGPIIFPYFDPYSLCPAL